MTAACSVLLVSTRCSWRVACNIGCYTSVSRRQIRVFDDLSIFDRVIIGSSAKSFGSGEREKENKRSTQPNSRAIRGHRIPLFTDGERLLRRLLRCNVVLCVQMAQVRSGIVVTFSFVRCRRGVRLPGRASVPCDGRGHSHAVRHAAGTELAPPSTKHRAVGEKIPQSGTMNESGIISCHTESHERVHNP